MSQGAQQLMKGSKIFCMCTIYYFLPRKNVILSSAAKWMIQSNIMLSKISQAQKKKTSCYLSYVDDINIYLNKKDLQLKTERSSGKTEEKDE